MKFFDKMNRYGMEIRQEENKYLLQYLTGDHINSVDTIEITEEEAHRIKDAYAEVDGKDIYKTPEGKAAVKKASSVAMEIIHYHRNKRQGLI